jgi:hypothetical protein
MRSLAQLETVINNHIQNIREGFHEIGMTLAIIRDEQLYAQQYESFEDYCIVRWGFSKSYASRLITGAEMIEKLLPIGNNLPSNESQTRELRRAAESIQTTAWELAVETAPGGKLTAGHIRSVVNVLQEAIATGAIDPGDGEQLPLSQAIKAAVTEETYERQQRQAAHIAEKQQRKPPIVISTATVKRVSDLVVSLEVEKGAAYTLSQQWGKKIKIVVYEEADDALPA